MAPDNLVNHSLTVTIVKTIFRNILSLCFFLLILSGCDQLLTETPAADDSLDGPIDGLTNSQRGIFALGDEAFGTVFTFESGLGPIFNQPSCERCHVGDGRADPSVNLIRFGRNLGGGLFELLPEFGGPQLQDRSMPGYPAETLPAEADAISVRGGPIVVGLGLLEAIPDSSILSRADENDSDGDGVSGKPNLVVAPEFLGLSVGPYGGKYIGRFGRKAGAINLLQQTATAYHQDIGVTSDYMPSENYNPQSGGAGGDPVADPEIPAATVNDVVFYLQTLRPPFRRNEDDPEVARGGDLFEQVKCASCHIPAMQTGEHPIAALSNKSVHAYTDLLLHDMGPELADNFIEGQSTGYEWRTTPLWGLGIVGNTLGGIPRYLHDGRTSDLREVIALHQGEADSSRVRFGLLSLPDQEALLVFLKSL